MRTHTTEGERICGSLRTTTPYLPIIRHHHERSDGRGYPDHLVGSDIPIGARIVAISDAWDAMTSDRPYRAGLEHDAAVAQVRLGAGTQWDAELTDVFLRLLDAGLPATVESAQGLHV
jgi:HD-GYP domain-containing protein (c-di-GMP phosphodiesterase class II)